MAEVNLELVLKRVDEVLAEQRIIRAGQEALTAKVGAMAASMVSMTKRLDDLTTSTQLIAVAVDDHSHRLDRIEKQLNLTHA